MSTTHDTITHCTECGLALPQAAIDNEQEFCSSECERQAAIEARYDRDGLI